MKKRIRRRPKKRIKILAKYRVRDPKTGKKVQIETKPEAVVRGMLTDLGLLFKKEYGVNHQKWYRVYDYLVQNPGEYCFLIEVMGDYWHAISYMEGKESYSKLSSIQKKNVRNDALKKRIAKSIGIPLIEIWERDIRFRPIFAKKIIEDELKRQKEFMLPKVKQDHIQNIQLN